MLIDYPDYYSKEVINKWRMAIEEHGGQVALFYNPVYVTHVICKFTLIICLSLELNNFVFMYSLKVCFHLNDKHQQYDLIFLSRF